MAYPLPTRQWNASEDVVVEFLNRLWQTKLKGITVFERWLSKTSDVEILTGLKTQLIDERRHLRFLGDEVTRLGGRLSAATTENVLSRPFAIALAQPNDLYRLCAFHCGIKAYTVDRCGHLIPLVGAGLARTLEQIAREEQGHIRWAEIRLTRALSGEDGRQLSLLSARMKASLEAAWARSRLPRAPRGRFLA